MSHEIVILERKQEENILNNLNYLIANQHLSANQIADKLGLPLVTVRRLMLGDTVDPRISTLKMIAEYFGVSLDLLVNGDVSKEHIKHQTIKPYFIPILSWQDLSKISKIEEVDLKNWKSWLPISLDNSQRLGDYAFALESQPSMIPRFSNGTIFVFDPELIVKDSDFALIRFLKSNEITLRQIIIDPPSWKLLPVVPTSEPLIFDKSQHEIIGIVCVTLLYNRRDK